MDSIKVPFLALVILKNNRYYTIRNRSLVFCKNHPCVKNKFKIAF
ncbi:flavoprotein oxidoreductase [Helicobacter pylori]